MEVNEEKVIVPTDRLVQTYIKIRDARETKKREFEAQDQEFDSQLKTIAAELMETCKTVGADSIKTPFGTVIRSIKSRYWTNDWDSMYDFIQEHSMFALLEKRIHQSNMKQFLEENPDVKPAGLNIDSEYTITVRRSK